MRAHAREVYADEQTTPRAGYPCEPPTAKGTK